MERSRMKIKDVEQAITDGTLCAVGKYSPRPAQVLAVRQNRRVYSGARWDFSGHTAHDGVKVRYQSDGEEAIVGPAEIISTWAAYETARDARRDRKSENDARIEQERIDGSRAVAALGVGRCSPRYSSRHSSFGTVLIGYEVVLTPAEALALASAAAGRSV